MGRKLREIYQNVTYHVHSRCINKEKLMKPNFCKDMMIMVIKETQEKYEFELNGFEILDDHFHFLIKTKSNGETISKIMQRIKSVFAKRYNRFFDRSGPFWNERYGAQIIEKAKDATLYLLYLIWYMAYNSFRKKLVKDPRNYKFSSINCYLDENYESKLNIKLHNGFKSLGSFFKEQVENFIKFEKIYIEKLRCQR